MNYAKSLFGLDMPMPDEIRQNVANRLFSSSPVFGGMFGPSYTAAQQIGRGLGFALAGPSREEQASEQIQNIIRRRVEQYEGEAMGDDFLREVGPLVAQDLIENGRPDMALSIMQKIPPVYGEGFKKDTAQAIRTERKTLSAEAGETFKRFNAILNNREAAKGSQTNKQNRTARAAMLVNLARLTSPEAVNEADIRNYSGAADPLAVVAAAFKGNNELDALLRRFDPFGSDFDADAIVQSAMATASAEQERVRSVMKDLTGRAKPFSNQERDILLTASAITDFTDVDLNVWAAMTPAQRRKYRELGNE